MNTYTIDDLRDHVGEPLGESQAHEITQEQVDRFADATHDHQWIHVDPERARKGPFGGPIAHGFLTLSLLPMLMGECLSITGTRMTVNYGLNRLRFPAPVPVGSRIKMRATLNSVEEFEGGATLVVGFEIGVEGASKPSAVGESVLRAYR